MRQLTISEMAEMFDLTRPTIRARLNAATLAPVRIEGVRRFYDMRDAGPAIFGGHHLSSVQRVKHG